MPYNTKFKKYIKLFKKEYGSKKGKAVAHGYFVKRNWKRD